MSENQTIILNFETQYEIRSAVESDIKAIKWSIPDWSSYWQEKWQRKLAGELDMYLATINDFPIARIWLNWTKQASDGIGEISSLAVMPPFQGNKIGTNLINFAEDIFSQKALKISQIGIDKPNFRAQKLYEKQGYVRVREEQDSLEYTTESGEKKLYTEDCWILHKTLG